MRWINEIPKNIKNDKIIVIGRGPSVDSLNLEQLREQTDYDIMTIADAIKLVPESTFSICYHHRGLDRIKYLIDKPKFMIMPDSIITFLINKRTRKKQAVDVNKLHKLDKKMKEEMNNTYFFRAREVKGKIDNNFDINVKQGLIHSFGSVVGVFHFLLGYMRYTNLFYIGFDGGTEYGKIVHSSQKEIMKQHAAKGYEKSWNDMLQLVKYYPKASLKHLREFLKGNHD